MHLPRLRAGSRSRPCRLEHLRDRVNDRVRLIDHHQVPGAVTGAHARKPGYLGLNQPPHGPTQAVSCLQHERGLTVPPLTAAIEVQPVPADIDLPPRRRVALHVASRGNGFVDETGKIHQQEQGDRTSNHSAKSP